MRRGFARGMAVLTLLLATCLAHAQPSTQGLPEYVPEQTVDGSLRIWGHGSYGAHTDFVEGLTRAWQEGFVRHQPGIRFDNRLHGTASAIGALYTGQGDLAFMGREIWEPEIAAFNEVRGYGPTGVDVLTGSFDVRNKGYAIAVFVHKDNPLDALTLAQLEAVYGVDRLRGHPLVRTWGDLGATGAWRDAPVHPYGLPIARGFADYFQDAVFKGARLWNPALREFADEAGSRGGDRDGGHKMLQAMASDPHAIGYAGMLYRHPDVKAIALAAEPGSVPVPPTLAGVASHAYPLTRLITMFVDRPPGQPLDPKVREFLRYILSREGQQAVLDHGHGYLPVPAAHAQRQRDKLD
jgi:phosphate transport system substrate-binding protein